MEREKNHIHIAGFMDNEVIATAVLVPEGNILKMQRVVVKKDFQSQGIASAMMKFCENYAVNEGFNEIYCHARDSAVQFYLKNNYVSEGDYFDEDTIPHLKLRKILTRV